MGGHVESHQPLQEGLRGLVVTEQSVSVHIISGQQGLRTNRSACVWKPLLLI